MLKNKLLLATALAFTSSLSCTTAALAYTALPYYIAVNAGIFQGSYDVSYRDQTDNIPQNIANTTQQHGYTEGIALGYSRLFHQDYLIGAELSANLDSHNANYQSGAASSAFTDNTQINNHYDLSLIPAILLNPSLAAYIKLGISYASIEDYLISPAGYTPSMTRYVSKRTAAGLASAIGIKKFINDHIALFAEANYHDYGTVNFSDFQNFTATYTHSAHMYSYGMVLGAAYHW